MPKYRYLCLLLCIAVLWNFPSAGKLQVSFALLFNGTFLPAGKLQVSFALLFDGTFLSTGKLQVSLALLFDGTFLSEGKLQVSMHIVTGHFWGTFQRAPQDYLGNSTIGGGELKAHCSTAW